LKRILLILLLLAPFLAHAQRNCGTMEYLEQEIANDPDRILRLEAIDEHTRSFEEAPFGQRSVVTIPVVFHVVWRTAAENISDAQVNAQLKQLNDDFARLNADASQTPALFAALGANTQVQFCLAQRDPSGNPTTGIVRRQTTVTSFSSNNAVKYTANGGSNAWPSTSYLNIWSCNLGSGLLGYAQFPGGAAATDGVVVLFSSIGSLNTPGTATNYNLGRTATHEVGHWLNLRHIWGDATCGSDLVNDTPVHNTSNGGCPTYPHYSTCSGAPVEMTMNYMDYTYDGCMNLFTQGQSTRMQALFATGGARVSLLSSLGCAPPSTSPTCDPPSGLAASALTTTGATLTWASVSGAISYNVQYRPTSTSTWTTVNTTSTSLVLSSLTAGTAYTAQVQSVCAASSSAYSATTSFTTAAAPSTCTDIWESNNSSGAAKTIPVNTTVRGIISSSTDLDWFKFNNTSAQRRIRIDLTDLPADYDVRLYRGTSTQVGIGQNGGTTSEAIVLNTTTVATYYLRVYGYNGAFNTSQCYSLRASISGTNFREITVVEVSEKEGTRLLGLYPNPATDKIVVDYIAENDATLNVMVYDGMGRLVANDRPNVGQGPSSFVMPLASLPNGVYVLQVVDGDNRYQQRFMVQR
jgi:hypothetical protein